MEETVLLSTTLVFYWKKLRWWCMVWEDGWMLEEGSEKSDGAWIERKRWTQKWNIEEVNR